jgi:hypothetical protein
LWYVRGASSVTHHLQVPSRQIMDSNAHPICSRTRTNSDKSGHLLSCQLSQRYSTDPVVRVHVSICSYVVLLAPCPTVSCSSAMLQPAVFPSCTYPYMQTSSLPFGTFPYLSALDFRARRVARLSLTYSCTEALAGCDFLYKLAHLPPRPLSSSPQSTTTTTTTDLREETTAVVACLFVELYCSPKGKFT